MKNGITGIRVTVEDFSGRTENSLEENGFYESRSIATATPTTLTIGNTTNSQSVTNTHSWHIPRPSLLGRKLEKENENTNWPHQLHPNSPSRGSTSSQGSTASTHSAASGMLLLTAANLATLATIHPPTVTATKPIDTASVASSTHFTMINGVGRPCRVYKKSWCAKNQLTVLVCTMSFLFMIGLLAGVLYMEMKAREKYN